MSDFVHYADVQDEKDFSFKTRMSNVHHKKQIRETSVKDRCHCHIANCSFISGMCLEFVSGSTSALMFCPLECWGSVDGTPSGISRVTGLDLSEFSYTGPGLAMNFLGKELLDREVEEELQPGKRPDAV